MSWQNDVIECIRVNINDMYAPYTYPDDRLERVALVAASQVMNEADFQSKYIVDINLQTITPDPTDLNNNLVIDYSFILMVSLKATCLIVRGEMKGLAQTAGIEVKDGPSTMNTTGVFKNYTEMINQFTKEYEFFKMNYKLINAWANSQAILTATTVRQIYGNLEVLPY